MASNRETPVDQLIAQFTPPIKGVWRTIASHQLPLDTLYDASNICIREGAAGARPGHEEFEGDALTGTPMGGIDYISAAAVRSLVVGTTSRLMVYAGGTWSNRTGAVTWAGTASNPVRFTLLEFGTPAVVYAVAANGVNPLAVWDGSGGNFATVTGTPPVFADICTSYDRAVGIVPPYSVMWGEALSLSTWAAANRRDLSDTPGALKAIRAIGTTGLAVYKEDSIWVGQPQGGPSSSCFAFFPKVTGVDGPAGYAAVVDAGGVQYYMTPTGRIGRFDGASHRWVADGLWPLTRTLVDSAVMGRAFGVYNPNFHEIYFYYPATGDSSLCKHMVCLSLPYPEAGIADHAGFPGVVGSASIGPLAGCTIKNSSLQDRAIILEDTNKKAYQLNEGYDYDAGIAFTSYVQTGLVAAPDVEPAAASVEPFLLKGASYGTATVTVMYSNVLDTAGGSTGSNFTLDLTTTPARQLEGFTTRGRFFGLKVSFTQPGHFRYFGSHLYTRSLGRGPATNPS